MKLLLPLALAACLAASPAAAETLDVQPVMKEVQAQCVQDGKDAGVKKAKTFCACGTKNIAAWVNGAEGVEQQTRLWSLKRNSLPESVTDEQVYARAAEAGVEENALKSLIIANYYTMDGFFQDCMDIIQ